MSDVEPWRKLASDKPFFLSLALPIFIYVGFVLVIIGANIHELRWSDLWVTWSKPEVRAAIRLTLITSSIAAILSVFFAVPIAYALSRFRLRGLAVVNALFDIPMVLPPLVVGLSLLIFFNKVDLCGGGSLEQWLNAKGVEVTFAVPAVILAQFVLATAYCIRLMKVTFSQIDSRAEEVALTLGCNRAGAFWRVALPQAGQGVLTAGVMAWARAMGEFGPILVFAGATRGKTEVLSTSIFLELNTGNIAGAAAIALLMILVSVSLIALMRSIGKSEKMI